MKNSIQVHARWRRMIAAITLLVMTAAGVVSGHPASDKKQRTGDIVAEALHSSRVANEINSPAEAPISIIDSSSVEISKSTYRKLTGTKTSVSKASSYPTVTLANNSDSAVTQVGLVLTNKTTGMRVRLKVGNINIAPHGTYVIDSEKWTIPALIRTQPEGSDDQPKVLSRKSVLRYDSDRAWLTGKASDISLTVVLTEQANGAKWDILHRGKVSTAQPNGLALRPVAYHPSAAPFCSCEGVVLCFDDGSWICAGFCYDCTFEDCALCAIIGCTLTCILIMQ